MKYIIKDYKEKRKKNLIMNNQFCKNKYNEYQIKIRTKYFTHSFVILIILIYISAIISEIYYWAQPIVAAIFITEIISVYLLAQLILKKAYWKFNDQQTKTSLMRYLTVGIIATLLIIINLKNFGGVTYYFIDGYFTLNCIQIFIAINFLEISILSIIRLRLDKEKS
jgi:hypothetical protein